MNGCLKGVFRLGCAVVILAAIVLIYTYLGGLTSALYNEVLQFFLIVLGFLPLVLIGLQDVGGWEGLTTRLATVSTNAGYAPGAWTDSWQHMGAANANPMGVEWFGMVMGLGFVLSFGYWCTDFLVVQRAMAADSMTAARRTPLLAAIPKMLFPALVILPGMIAIALHATDGGLLPLGSDGTPNYNLAVPAMLAHYLPSGLLGLGLTALMASFMSGMAGNVTAFSEEAEATGSAQMNFSAVSIENVSVPAGSFEALRLDVDVTLNVHASYQGISLPVTFGGTYSYWFAPGVGWVKASGTGNVLGNSFSETIELQSYNVP